MKQHKVCIVIQARISSSRLPAKALLPLGGVPSVILCALRVVSLGYPVVVATSTDETDDILEKLLNEHNIVCFRGALKDVLERFTDAVAEYDDNDWVVRLTADNIFPDGDFINLLLNKCNDDLDYMGTSDPENNLPYGLSAEIIKVHALRQANKIARSAFDREHVTPYIKRNFRCRQFSLENVPSNWKNLRCTLDTFADYSKLLKLFKEVEDPSKIPWGVLVQKLESVTDTSLVKISEIGHLPSANNSLFTLGTVQLGLDYGIFNHNGLPTDISVRNLINRAVSSGIRTFDTARVYGLSEQRIGNVIQKADKENISIITKLHTLNYLPNQATEEQVRHAVRASVYESCYHLKLSNIDTILLHRWEHRYKWNGAVWDELLLLKKAGVVRKTGVSVTKPEEAVDALTEAEIEHIQCPVNILDWRWQQNDFLAAVHKRKDVVFFARSVYLQGLLIMRANEWPSFRDIDIDILNLDRALDYLVKRFQRIDRKDLCLAYVRGLPWVSSLVLGMETETQLQDNLQLFAEEPLNTEQLQEVHQIIPPQSERLLDPAQWTQ